MKYNFPHFQFLGVQNTDRKVEAKKEKQEGNLCQPYKNSISLEIKTNFKGEYLS